MAVICRPEYTPEALASRIEGSVELSFTIDVDGATGNIVVTRSLDPGLDRQAIDCIRACRFEKIPKQVTLPVQINFRLPEDEALP